MEVVYKDSIGFIYDVCQVLVCKSNSRETWINAFLCEGSENEDMLYVDSLLKKFQKIEISNKLIGYKSKNQIALIGELCGKYIEKKGCRADVDDFVRYITDPEILKEAIAEFYLKMTSSDMDKLLEEIYCLQHNADVKAELYSFFLFTEKYVKTLKKELEEIIQVLDRIYVSDKNDEICLQKERFNVESFLENMKEYLKTDTWRLGVEKCVLSFSVVNPYLIARQIDGSEASIIVLGIECERFFKSKRQESTVDLVIFGSALGEKIRLKMLKLLHENGEMSLTDFSNKLDIVNAVALYHIDILKEAKLILRRDQGRRVLYWINDRQFYKAMEEMKKIL